MRLLKIKGSGYTGRIVQNKVCGIVKVCGNFIPLKETSLPVKQYLDSLIL